MKRLLSLIFLLCLVLFVVASTAQADGVVIITPYKDGPIYNVSEGQRVFINAAWGACSRGRAQSAKRASSVSMEVYDDDGLYLVVEPPASDHWTRPIPLSVEVNECAKPTDTIWQVKWSYQLGTLPAGEYQLHFLWTTHHPLPDGGGYDGDSFPDVARGEPLNVEANITIIVG